MGGKKVYDISVTLGDDSPLYPGDRPFKREAVKDMSRGDDHELSNLSLSAHSGTHIDAPAHFLKDGKGIGDYEADRFLVPAVVIEVKDKAVRPEDIAGTEVRPGDAVLFKTENSRSGLSTRAGFSKDYVTLTPEAAQELVLLKAGLVGIDYLSIDACDSEGSPVHRILLSADVLVLETINLAEVPPGRYRLVCLPLKLKGEASPVRALLIPCQEV